MPFFVRNFIKIGFELCVIEPKINIHKHKHLDFIIVGIFYEISEFSYNLVFPSNNVAANLNYYLP